MTSKILDFDKTLKLLETFLEINEDLEIHQNTFKCLIYNLSEVYPSKFKYIEKILSLIKTRIKPETLNGLCEYYNNVNIFLIFIEKRYIFNSKTC